MKSLKFTALFVALLFVGSVAAQMTEECKVNLSLFTEYAKVKNYADAYEPWAKVYKECPTASKNIYSLGVRILEWKIKQATTQDEYKALINRLNRIEGQVRGIKRMIEENAYCTDILVQSSAVNAAVNAFNRELLSNHIKTCVADDIRAGKDETVDELLATLQKLMK